MNTSDVIALIAIVLSLIATLVSGFAVVRTERRAIKVTTYNNATELTLEIDRVFVQNPGLRPFFYDNLSLEGSSQDRNLVLAVCELTLDVLECIWDHREEYDRQQDRDAWKSYIKDMLRGSPVMRDYLDQKGKNWYPTLFDLLEEDGKGSAAELAPDPGSHSH